MNQHRKYVQYRFDGSIQRGILATSAVASVELCLEYRRYETDDGFVGQVFVAFLVARHVVQHVDHLFLLTEETEVIKISKHE